MPKEEGFFDLFSEGADKMVAAALEFRKMVENLESSKMYSERIHDIEHQADKITHDTVELLHETFITPFDREDIRQLAGRIDDVTDFIYAAAVRVDLYQVKKVPKDFIQLADLCVSCTQTVKLIVENLRKIKNPEEIKKGCVELNRLENEADHVLRSAMARLFKEEDDVKTLIKMKELYELLETVTDRCEDVAEMIEGIVVEYS